MRALLGCTIRYADNRVRITAELIDSTGLQTLWQADYEPSLADIADVFAVQADIAMNIANALSVVFTPAEREVLERPPTVSTEAYVLFLKSVREPDYDKTIELSSRPSQPTESSRPRERRWRSSGPRSSSTRTSPRRLPPTPAPSTRPRYATTPSALWRSTRPSRSHARH